MNDETYIELSLAEVANRARQLWKADGKPNGRNLEYWLQAELELLHARRAHLRKNTDPGSGSRWDVPQVPASKPLALCTAELKQGRNGST